jgi:hypothetical protein
MPKYGAALSRVAGPPSAEDTGSLSSTSKGCLASKWALLYIERWLTASMEKDATRILAVGVAWSISFVPKLIWIEDPEYESAQARGQANSSERAPEPRYFFLNHDGVHHAPSYNSSLAFDCANCAKFAPNSPNKIFANAEPNKGRLNQVDQFTQLRRRKCMTSSGNVRKAQESAQPCLR